MQLKSKHITCGVELGLLLMEVRSGWVAEGVAGFGAAGWVGGCVGEEWLVGWMGGWVGSL